ncbi:nodulin MtN21 /EamA-like transporter family protein [Prunus dulcis]|uniref:Nodulin MtN21 /EamA-like transporter family protein n=1 Tax=Prunus dulcis TaxID=3755 RepID=A0A4Y1QW95_PRUDU|nr:nodulin MtN21 /EamA-like transporter family protein [Prunus dulcis]
MSLKVFSAYRVLFASAVMIPLALEQKTKNDMDCASSNFSLCVIWDDTGSKFILGEYGIYTNNIYCGDSESDSCLHLHTGHMLSTGEAGAKKPSRDCETCRNIGGDWRGDALRFLQRHHYKRLASYWPLAMPQSSTSSSNPHHSNGYALGTVLALLSCLSSSAWLIIQGILVLELCVHDDMLSRRISNHMWLYLVIWVRASNEEDDSSRTNGNPPTFRAQTIEIVSTTPMPIHSTTSRG